jgi:hypothetical protein
VQRLRGRIPAGVFKWCLIWGNLTGSGVRGPSAPQNLCVLAAEFLLDGDGAK